MPRWTGRRSAVELLKLGSEVSSDIDRGGGKLRLVRSGSEPLLESSHHAELAWDEVMKAF